MTTKECTQKDRCTGECGIWCTGQNARPTKDEYYLRIASAVAARSTCLKRHYGCVIVKDDVIVATGYNGSPRGAENCCDRGTCKREDMERYMGYEKCDSVHAEQNAIICASREELKDATLYLACIANENIWDGQSQEWVVDMSPVPCSICRRMIANSGIKRIVNGSGDIE